MLVVAAVMASTATALWAGLVAVVPVKQTMETPRPP
jgi:hypothetical protein